MDALSLLRMMGALLLVLGMLVAALWAVKRYDLTLPRTWLERLGTRAPEKRLQVVERLAIDQRRSLVLLRRDDREFSVLIGPEGTTVLESAVAAPPAPSVDPAEHPAAPEAPAQPLSFADRIAALPEVWFAPEPPAAARPDLH